MIRKLIAMGAGAAALTLAYPAMTQAMEPQGPTADFVTKAAQSDEFERQEGRLAETHGHNSAVKKFGAEMVDAHTQTTMELKAAIRQAHMTPPPKPVLTNDQMQMIQALKAMRGGAFDKAYMDQQVKAHQDTLGTMQAYAQSGQPGPIRDAAQKTAPLVQHHLDMARDVQSHLGS